MPMTTYDTRISYWSSDVCSSALTIQTALFGTVIIGDTISVQAIAAILISLAGVIALSVARTELTARPLLTRWQFGRVAWRERVCQDVWIWVFGASLKHKKDRLTRVDRKSQARKV